ncbi:uncharacterized protein LOC123023568 [Varanus komodoensis]|uniref:uncharacterized protein LOC123023568 n=1 Tax=Varanus komodoensis TaxID=61221 RepID=UPI001CF77840|nr:uncharacterized protein LOC123023568 [Varanus komodoensis]
MWLQRARRSIEGSPDWGRFTESLFEAVQQQLWESHVHTFPDLSETEKGFVLQKAVRAIQGGDSYKNLILHISRCLEEEVYRQIAQEIQDGDHRVKNKSAMLLSHLKDGVMILLEERPQLKGQLRALFNQPLPADLRQLAWRLHLSHTEARLSYLSQLARKKTTSVKDREISLRCQALLDSEPTFQSLKKSNVAFRCLRNALSYYHKLQGMATPLENQEYFLPVPLLQAILDSSPPSISVDSVSALLVEEFVKLMKLRPHLLRLSPVQDPAQASIMAEVASWLERIDSHLVIFLASVYTRAEEDSSKTLLKGLRCMLQPAIETLFAGYLSMGTLLFIWDQIILGLEHPSYSCIPAFATILILLLRGQLLECQSPVEIEAALKIWGPSLPVEAFQYLIRKYFYEELHNQLHGEYKDPYPIHDPTQTFPPWNYGEIRSKASSRTKPEDRRRIREERESLQRQQMERTVQEERLQRFREEEQKRQKEFRWLQLLEETKRKSEMEKIHLEEQLLQERQVSYEMQSKAEEHISQLQAEIKMLVERKMPSSSAYSAGSLVAPAPSPESQTPSQADFCLSETVVAESHHATASRGMEVATIVMLDLLTQVMEAADAIVNSFSAEEREHLDAVTAKHLHNYNQDCKNAKMELFGYEISEEEIEAIPEPRRKEVRKKLEGALRRGAEARYKAAQGRNL